MGSKQGKFHIFFLPFMAPGHMMPIMDMARLFSTRGIKSTIVTTPLNKPSFSETIDVESKISLLTVNFPWQEAGLPQGCESVDGITSPELIRKFFKATTLLQYPFESLMEEFNPNCVIIDSFFPWANSSARKFRIPCLSFNGCSYFSECVIANILKYKPYKNDMEFVVPNLPHEIKLTRAVLTPIEKEECPDWLTELFNQVRESRKACDGVIMNSFYQLEPDYVEYYEKCLGMKHWHVGPLSLYSRLRKNEQHQIGKKSSIDVDECMKWLDEKEANSVVYVCFGSMTSMSNAQLHELALALEFSGRSFILVVKKESNEWMPYGFEARIKEQGLIISGWAPQGLILSHVAVGGFMTHCGWNSILESVSLGVPMVTWPCHAEQFHNENLVTNIIRIGISVGVEKWVARDNDNEDIVKKEDIVKAIIILMSPKDGQDMRERAECLAELAKRAIEEGGSSCYSVDKLIQELISYNM